MSVDWSKAPGGAEFSSGGSYYKYSSSADCLLFYQPTCGWVESKYQSISMLKSQVDYQPRPQQWPTEARIQNIGQNGGDGLHYDEQREAVDLSAGSILKKMTAEKPQPELGKYDRRIKGKYNTGTCTVDVYRVLSAFEITEPELQHCIKKLLAAGQRGAKDYQQDLKEAAVSLGMLIDRLQE